MSNLSVLGSLVSRAELLQQLNEYYGSTVIADHEVKNAGSEEGLFLLDFIQTRWSAPAKIFELVPDLVVRRTDFDGI